VRAATGPRTPRTPTPASSLAAIAELLPFVQFELAGTVGIEPGRYLEAAGPGGRERVLVVATSGAPPPPRRRLRPPRPGRPRGDREPAPVPLSTLTVIDPEPVGGREPAEGRLAELRRDPERVQRDLDRALALVNRAVHAHRAAVLDPGLADVTPERALAIRIGFGTGEELADGRFTTAIELPPSPRRGRGETLRPQERLAAVLGGREAVPAFELLLLRARADLDCGRTREAALQLRAGLDALLAEPSALAAPGQDDDLAALEGRRDAVGEAGRRALAGELDPDSIEGLEGTLLIAERALRRHRALGPPV